MYKKSIMLVRVMLWSIGFVAIVFSVLWIAHSHENITLRVMFTKCFIPWGILTCTTAFTLICVGILRFIIWNIYTELGHPIKITGGDYPRYFEIEKVINHKNTSYLLLVMWPVDFDGASMGSLIHDEVVPSTTRKTDEPMYYKIPNERVQEIRNINRGTLVVAYEDSSGYDRFGKDIYPVNLRPYKIKCQEKEKTQEEPAPNEEVVSG